MTRSGRSRPLDRENSTAAPARAPETVRSACFTASFTGFSRATSRRSPTALLGLSVATLLKLIPPAATKAAIDYVMLAQPIPDVVVRWCPVAIPESPKQRLLILVGATMIVTLLGTLTGLWSRWLATRATKRVQIGVRRKVYEHAMRLPLHRVYQLKSGGASSLLREDAGGVGELVFSMIYNPWRAVVQFIGGLVVLAWVDWRLLAGAVGLLPVLYFSDLIWNRRIRPIFREVRKKRQQIDSETTEVFGGMRVVRAFGRQKSESVRFMGENHLMIRLELFVWLALAVDRADLGVAAAVGLGRPAFLRRAPGSRRHDLAGRPDDVPGLPGDAPGADGRAGDERHPVPEQPLRLRPRARPAGRAPRDGRPRRRAEAPEGRGRRPAQP